MTQRGIWCQLTHNYKNKNIFFLHFLTLTPVRIFSSFGHVLLPFPPLFPFTRPPTLSTFKRAHSKITSLFLLWLYWAILFYDLKLFSFYWKQIFFSYTVYPDYGIPFSQFLPSAPPRQILPTSPLTQFSEITSVFSKILFPGQTCN